MQPARLICCLAVALAVWLVPGAAAAAQSAAGGVLLGPGDTVLPAGIEYSGYRLHIRAVELVKERRGRYLVRCDVVNTGRRPANMGPGFPVRFLQTVFDETLAAAGLVRLAIPLRTALTESREEFPVGAWREGLEFWLEPGEEERAAPRLTIDDFERRQVTGLKASRRPAERATTDDAGTASARDTPAATNSAPAASARCADLAIADMRVVERERQKATVQWTIVNRGSADLRVADLPPGLPLEVFLGGSPTISGSSRRVGQFDLTAAARKQLGEDGAVAAGESLSLVEEVDTRAATRYTAVLTARLDPGQTLRECDETNNEASTVLED